MKQKSGRQLAAVLALDVVDYSKMMGVDEAHTLRRLLRRRKFILDPLVAQHRGRVIKGTGDGILAEFASARDALHAALEIQQGLADANGEEAGDRPMLARIGINIGDIIFEDGDIYGDGVNVAARLEASAPTGGVCLSGNALDEVRRLGIPYQDAGELSLKNIVMPIRAYHILPNVIAGVDRRLIAPSGRTAAVSTTATSDEGPAPARGPRLGMAPHRIAAAALLTFLLIVVGWWWFRPPPGEAHGLTVRLSGFQPLSKDLPPTIEGAIDSEIAAAFNADGVVGVSTAAAQAVGSAPLYALGGTIQRDGATIRLITRLTNERSGATVWGNDVNYDSSELAKIPRHIAVDVGNIVRCGLFGASTYHEPLADFVLGDYMRFCQGHWDPNIQEGRKALVPAQRVVAAVPDFSWGWAAVAGAYWKVAGSAESAQMVEEARASGRAAADRAIALDPSNSEALYIKSMIVDRHDWVAREALLKRAVAARRLDCGCEFHQYGWLLMNVGRITDAVERLRQATDMLAYYVYTPLNLAEALVAAGRPDEAKPLFQAAVDLAPDATFARRLTVTKATFTSDAAALGDPKLPLSAPLRSALLRGYKAALSNDVSAKADAAKALLALPGNEQQDGVALLLANLGAAHEAFQVAARRAEQDYPGPSIFWYRTMRATLDDPGFPQVAQNLGLLTYWRATRTKPDVCKEKAAPRFCQLI